jgi:hypothetical protein
MRDINKSIKLMQQNSYAYKIRALINIENNKIDNACKDLIKETELGYTPQYGNEVKELKALHCN